MWRQLSREPDERLGVVRFRELIDRIEEEEDGPFGGSPRESFPKRTDEFAVLQGNCRVILESRPSSSQGFAEATAHPPKAASLQ